MLYNRWHVDRMKLILQEERKSAWNRVPWDPKQPYLRRKFEKKYCAILGAESYLLQILENGIKLRLESILC